MAYVGKVWDKTPYRVYCLMGDGESAEGNIWEARTTITFIWIGNSNDGVPSII